MLHVHDLLQERRNSVGPGLAGDPGWQSVAALVSAPASPGPVLSDGLQLHSHLEALVKPAGRALLTGGDGDRALGAPQADVVLLVLHSPLEESLAGLAGEDPVVEARYLVSAHRTRTVDQLLAGDAGLSRQAGELRVLLLIAREDDGVCGVGEGGGGDGRRGVAGVVTVPATRHWALAGGEAVLADVRVVAGEGGRRLVRGGGIRRGEPGVGTVSGLYGGLRGRVDGRVDGGVRAGGG